jgi:hypothetical protein
VKQGFIRGIILFDDDTQLEFVEVKDTDVSEKIKYRFFKIYPLICKKQRKLKIRSIGQKKRLSARIYAKFFFVKIRVDSRIKNGRFYFLQ